MKSSGDLNDGCRRDGEVAGEVGDGVDEAVNVEADEGNVVVCVLCADVVSENDRLGDCVGV